MGTCDLWVVLFMGKKKKRLLFLLGEQIPEKGEEGSCHMKIRAAPLKFRHYEWGEPPKCALKHQRKMLSWVQSQNHQNSPVSKPLHHGSFGARLL